MNVKEAFHEVYQNTPKIVKHTARKFGRKDAEKQRVAIALHKAGMSKPDSSGANFVSDNSLFIPPGAGSAETKGSERVPYKISDEVSLDDQAVKPVTRTMNPVEALRQKSNQTRDMRTNLGRGKPGLVLTEGSAPTSPTR